MQGRVDDHQTGEDLESYSLGRLALSPMPGFEEHLLICQRCRAKLNAIEPYSVIHYTRDGPFYSRITKLRTGTLFARQWGRSLEGGKEFHTCDGAKAYLMRTFSRMFPEHACTARCGATGCVEEYRSLISAGSAGR
jgi:hypothetical protein